MPNKFKLLTEVMELRRYHYFNHSNMYLQEIFSTQPRYSKEDNAILKQIQLIIYKTPNCMVLTRFLDGYYKF